jgi:type IV pilus assembly protein PilY1
MIATLVLQPLGVYAATITPLLTNVPLQGLNQVKPNIMFTMDDSGSMALASLPDYLSDGNNRWCRNTAGAAVPCPIPPVAAPSPPPTSPPLASKSLNHIYYDPAITYFPGKRPDGTNLPCEATDSPGSECQGPLTAVYTDGFAGYPNANSSATTDLTNGYPDEVFCSTATPTTADLATGVTDGSVCRYNGVTYGGVGGYRYPSAAFPYPRAVTGNPYYYTITSVQFCDTPDLNGWGTGICSPRWSPLNPYVSYGSGGLDPTAFVRVDINPFDTAQMSNFARWYAFARTRVLAMKTAGGIAFASSALADTRIGFHTLNSFATKFFNVQDFTAANKASWFSNFYSVTPSGSTPSLTAVQRIGEYFSNRGTAAGLPGVTDPLDPVTGKCQPNYHLFATDGYTNEPGLNPGDPFPVRSGFAGSIGDSDLNVPGSLPGPIPGFTPGQPFPLPYREGSGTNAASDTMSDIAMYYWIHDLRPDVPDLVKDTIAPWQHVVFYGLALGAEGTLTYPTRINDVTSGALPWPKPTNNTPSAIDDLWHAAINARGQYFNAQSAQELAEGVVSALADFTAQSGTGTAVGLAGVQLTAARSFGYRTSFEAGWWGDVKKYALDPNTGALPIDANGNPLNAPVWSAASKLGTQAAGSGWDTDRRIVTINSVTGGAVAFRVANLSPAQRTSLTAGWATIAPAAVPTAQQVADYLRGDRSNEGIGLSNFRVRAHTLGDIVGSGAVPVGAPSQPYNDAGNPGYRAFALAKASRTPMVYVGSNDGMLHALIDSNTADAGKEAWAFVPSALFTNGDPNDTSHAPSHEFQLGALSYRPFGLGQAVFKHQFYVNATPRIWDIDFANTNTSTAPTTGNDWRTILVGGLGAGGRAVYALDVTNPVLLTDTEAAVASSGRVLWEFTDPNLGYVYDAPTLVKTTRYGWVALVTSGYNNPGGKGFLYVIDPKTGTLLKKIATGVGSDANPSGLSTIRAFTASRRDPYVLQAYGGDLLGNVWRFDLSDPNDSNWKVELIATLKDPANNPQPITTGVRIEIDQNNNVDRYLFIGTGQLLGKPDLIDNSVTNTLYVIKDGTRNAPEPAPSTPYSRANLNSVSGTTTAGFSGPATGRGWYQDAADVAGQPKLKIITDVTADVQTVVYAFSKPSSDPCEAALTSSLFARDFTTGSSVLQPSAGGAVVASIDDIGAIAGVALIQGQPGAAGAASGDVRAQVTTMKGQVFSFGSSSLARRRRSIVYRGGY